MRYTQTRVFQAQFIDDDSGDTATGFSWKFDQASSASLFTDITTSTGSVSATFTPGADQRGIGRKISVSFTDSYDTSTCTWTQDILDTCSITSAVPSTATLKVANASGTTSQFAITPNYSDCAISWKLNGTTLSSTEAFAALTSGQLLNGPAENTVTATVSDGTSTPVTRSWSVTKNRVPVCASRTPASNPAAINYNQTQAFSSTFSDPDSDAISGVSWNFNGMAGGTLFSSITTTALSSSSTFVPSSAQMGLSQAISVSFSDSFDSSSCSWTMDVIRPDPLTLLSCSPDSSFPVVLQSAGDTSKVLTIAATGSLLTYHWIRNGSTLSSASTPTLSLTSDALAVGTYLYRSTVQDQYGESDYCEWTVKRNAPPVMSASSPSSSTTIKINANASQAFSVAATDANSEDTLTYSWTIDGNPASAMLPSGLNSATFSPGLDPAGLDAQGLPQILGPHVIAVTVSDGNESFTKSWNVEVNLLSPACNDLMNSSVAAAGGKTCTLAGDPRVGVGLAPADPANTSAVKIMPRMVIDDGSGNLILSDEISHAVFYYNRSGVTITRFNQQIGPGKMALVAGMGAAGTRTANGTAGSQVKLYAPNGLAFQPNLSNLSLSRLFISDNGSARVLEVSSSGTVTTVFGGGSSHSNGVIGTSHECVTPGGLQIVTHGAKTWLYIACYSSHRIKRMNITTADPDYGKGYVVVGNGQTGTADGQIALDANGNALSNYAMVNAPYGLSADSQGNIYWVEAVSRTLRMATTSGSSISFFDGTRSTTASGWLIADRMSGSALTSFTINSTLNAIQPSGAVDRLVFVAPSATVNGSCVPVAIQSRNSSNQGTPVSSATTVNLTPGTGGTFYSDSTCSAPSSITSATIPSGGSFTTVYYSNSTDGTATLQASSGALTTATATMTVAASGTASTLNLITAPNHLVSGCLPIIVQSLSSTDTAANVTSATTVRLRKQGVGNFYSDSNCTTLLTSSAVTIPSGAHTALAYYASTVRAGPNEVVTIAGRSGVNGAWPNSAASPQPFGVMQLQDPQLGVDVLESGGSVTGFFTTTWGAYRIHFLNNTSASTVMGGSTVPAYQAGVVAGTGSPGFTGDAVGNTALLNFTHALRLNADKSRLLIADWSNFRVRQLDLSIGNGELTTVWGNGYARWGNLGDSQMAANRAYFQRPSDLAFDTTNRKLYIADWENSRIRQLDLFRGLVSTAVGKGTGGATVENETPQNVMMMHVTGVQLASISGRPFLFYSEFQNTVFNTANNNCMVRAWNLSSTDTSAFGVNVMAGRVASVAGDYNQGCGDYSGDGTALNQRLPMPGSMAAYTDGSGNPQLYINSYNPQDLWGNRHCIWRLSPSGQIATVVGTCGSAGAGTSADDGPTSSAKIVNATQIAIDPDHASDGNFFFVDNSGGAANSRLRYVNFKDSAVTIAGVNVSAASMGVGRVVTLWNVNTRSFGLAVYSDATMKQICVGSGRPLREEVSQGAHNIRCYNRSAATPAQTTLRIGPADALYDGDTNPITSAAPMDDSSQEGVAANATLMRGPVGLTFDTEGNLYFADRGNNLIRFVRRWVP
jgi:hypothetical protein